MFGGTTLSRDKEWVDTMHEFAMDGCDEAQKLKQFPSFMKPIAQYLIPEVVRLHRHYTTAKKLLVSVLTDPDRQNRSQWTFCR